MEMYRHEIDGMRAFAVISVIFFHAKLPLFSGGYVGVDVFFVISGYLITSIILSEHNNGTFSLLQFYERRARRILPGLFLVLFICLPLAFYCMLPDQLHDFAQGLIAITFGLSNVLFWLKEDYFNSNTELNPLVHTWSLAVEEQFYILFALIFIVFSKHQHRCILYIIISITVVSLILAQWSANLQLAPPFIVQDIFWFAQRDWVSFYLLTGRAWELLFGSLTAFYLRHHKPNMFLWKQIAAVIGLGLIFFAIFYMDETTPFPSFYSLIPTVGASLLIIYGDQETIIGRILSMKILTMVGLCSYSAYLWHQPLFAFVRLSIRDDYVDIKMKIALILLTFGLAYIAWWLVETPFRNRIKYSRRQIVAYALTAAFLLNSVSIGILTTSKSGYGYKLQTSGSTYNSLKGRGMSNSDYPVETFWRHYIHQRFTELMNVTSYKNNTQRKKLAIIGDSYAKDFVNMAFENGKLKNYQIRVYEILFRCQMYIGPEDRSRFILPQDRRECSKKYNLIDAMPLIQQSDVIILASNWHLWAAQRINVTIQALNLRPTQTLIVVGYKAFCPDPPTLYVGKSYEYRVSLRWKITPMRLKVNSVLIKNLNSNITMNLMELVCGENYICPIFTPENQLISPDGNHLSKSGAKFVGKIIFRHPPLKYL